MIFIILTILGLGLNVSTQDGLEIQNHLAVEKRAQHEQFGTNWCRHEEKRIHLNNEGTGEEAGYCVGNGYIHAEFKTLDEAKEAFDRRPMDTCGGISLDIDLKLYTLRSGPVVLEESFINEVAWTPCTEEEQIKVDADAGRNDNQGGWDVYDGRYLGGYCTSDYAYDTLDECKEAYKHTNPPGKCGGITYENVKAGEYVLKVMCDDTSTIYIDGQKKDVPGPNNWGQLATLKIPASTNTIGIQCHNGGGSCGITAEVTDETGQVLLVSDNSWKCSNKEEDGWTADGFTEDDSWKPAAENRPFITGCYLSDERAWKGMSMDKKVIWTENKDSTVYCRRELPQGKYTLRQGRDPQDSPNGAVTWYPMRNGSWKEDSKTQKAEKKKVAREKERKAKEKSAEAKFTADTEIDISQEYTNLALNQQAEQKDTVSTRTALKAVDGNRDGNWSGKSLSSTRSKNGWWRVTLSKVYYISYIDVYNRMDKSQERLRNAQLSVDGTLIGTIPQVSGVQKYTFPVDKDGQVVQIKGVSGQKLQLAEVEVYGRDSESKSGEYVLKVMCDDTSTIYIDGEKKDVPGPNNWGQLATLKIPASTNTIGIQCHNGGGSCGITAEVTDETGQVLLVSDNSWKCSNKEEDGWTADGFTEDDSWKPAAENRPFITGCYLSNERAWKGMSMDKKVIWTENKDSTVYCRRELPQLPDGKESTEVKFTGNADGWVKYEGKYLEGYCTSNYAYETFDECREAYKHTDPPSKCGGITYENVKAGEYVLKVMCDDTSTIYIDGEKKDVPGPNNWGQLATLKIPASTNTIGIQCHNGGGSCGITAEVTDETGQVLLVSDNSWKCSNKEEDGWTADGFTEDDSWKPAAENQPFITGCYLSDERAWIGMSMDKKVIWTENKDSTVYCRRELPQGKYTLRQGRDPQDSSIGAITWFPKKDGSGKGQEKDEKEKKKKGKRERERKAEIERVAKEIEDRKAERKLIEKEKADEKREREQKAEIERVAKEIENKKAERKFIEKEKADEKREGERKAEIERVAKEIEDRKAKRKFIEKEKADEKREGERKAEIERVAKEIEDRKAERKFKEKEEADEKREGERKAEIERVAKEIEDRKAARKFIEKEKSDEKREEERKAEIERVAKEIEDRKAERKFIEKEKSDEKREGERKAEIERVAKEIEDRKAERKFIEKEKADEKREGERKAEIERVAKEIEDRKAKRKFIEREKADEKREGERKAEIERVAKEIEDRKAERKFIEKEKADEKREGERKAEIERVAKEIEDRKAERKFIEKEKANEKRERERKAEIERVAKELEDRKAERKLIEKEKAGEKRERERKAEIERVAKEIEDKKAKVKAEKERKAKEESERQRKEREQADKERKEREQADRERKAREKAEKEREQADKERKEREQADRERKAREKAEKERAESERTQKEKSPEALNNGRYCGWREIPNTKLNMGLAGRIMNRLNLEDAKALCLKTETCQGVACKNFEECLLSSCTSKGRKYFKGWTTYVPIPCEFETEGFGKKAYVAFQDAFCGFKACLVDRFNYYFGM
ncbi:uncharacterized protein LOC134825120 isoform X1 [Bolinopsis microptera]|uniref:uncharacterized protein LOC134825120 isoform X1 n=1 Tax=Bolinopsis microptera TaxID=2820187 RepID=UPI003078C1D0